MAAVPDQPQALNSGTKAAGDKSSKKSKKVLSKELKVKYYKGAWVNIGPAVDKWCAMKAKHKIKSNADMALYLLDTMESRPTGRVSAEASSLKKTFSKSEVQKLIEQEMHKTVKNSETRMQGLVETVHGINLEERCEKSIQKLQVRINLVSRRTEKALSCLKKMEEKATPQNELEKICADEALTVAMTDISHEEPPPILTPCGSPECTKNNTRNHQDQEPTPRIHHEHEEKDQAESWITYPPLPATTSPSVLSSTAVLYSIPQKLEVNLALTNPTQLSVLWDVVEKDPFAPPMESYTIFLAMEKVKGSDVFSDWHTYKKVEALALPMRALIKKYKKRGHRVCAAVLGKDIFGRYGPYSDVVTATMPE